MRRTVRTTLLLLAVAAAPAACSDGGPDGYDLEVQQQFTDQCAEVADRAACRCIYQRITETIPFERFEELDAELEDDPAEMPAEIEQLAIDCAASTSAPG